MEDFPIELKGGVWHTTHPDRYSQILASGRITPEPELDDSERFFTDNGPDGYPYIRSLGGISLFDFRFFDPLTYNDQFPSSQVSFFVPYQSDWLVSVWIEIRFELLGEQFIAGSEIYNRYHREKDYGRNYMPMIEAASIGDIPALCFGRVLRCCSVHPKLVSDER